MFFNFGPEAAPDDESTSREENKLDIAEVLKHIDSGDSEWFGTLEPEKQKLFTPYTVQRWVASIDDSSIVTCSSKSIEDVFGKWAKEGKEQITGLSDTFNETYPGMVCSSVQKYEHAKFDWRIKFSMSSVQASKQMKSMLESFGAGSVQIISGDATEYAQDHLMMMNTVVNKNLFDLKDHPELLYRMMCSIAKVLGKPKSTHNWMQFAKNSANVNAKILAVLKDEHGVMDMNEMEYKILLRDITKNDFDAILRGQAFEESDIKALMKVFKTEKEKHQ